MAGMIKRRMMAYLGKHMISCEEAAFLVSRSIDDRLPLRKRLAVRIHLWTCHLCKKYAAQLGELDALVSQYRTDCTNGHCKHHMSEHQKDEIRAKVDEALRAR